MFVLCTCIERLCVRAFWRARARVCVYIKVINASDLKEAEKRDSPTHPQKLLPAPPPPPTHSLWTTWKKEVKQSKGKKPAPVGVCFCSVDRFVRQPTTLLLSFPGVCASKPASNQHSFKWLLNAPINRNGYTHKYVIYCLSFSPRRLSSCCSLFCSPSLSVALLCCTRFACVLSFFRLLERAVHHLCARLFTLDQQRNRPSGTYLLLGGTNGGT